MTEGRLDTMLVARGLARSRTQAQALVRDGHVLVDGQVVTKVSTTVGDGQELRVVGGTADTGAAWITSGWVGRGALKLEHALQLWTPAGLQVAGRRSLDVGASTGGFTQVLLAHGASHVVALDVGHDQLDARLRDDERVTDLSGTNIRTATVRTIGGPVGVVASDVSFISLSHVIPVLPGFMTPDAEVVLLVKPQFEAGRAALDRHGVVRSAEDRRRALTAVTSLARDHGLAIGGLERSPITGAHGNAEYLLWLRPEVTGMIGWGLDPEESALRCHELSQEET